MTPVHFHVDMDAFYASVEQQDNPQYKGKPVIIGASPGQRGVVSACSYEARKYGVHSAMPISQAYRRCPGGVYLPVRMKRYQEVSKQIMALFDRFTPRVQQISVDEAFLDMTGTERLFGPPRKTAEELKEEVRGKTGLTISVGVATNKFLAKIASDLEKPDGLCVVTPGKEEQFIMDLPLKNIWGIGKKTLERLEELNITTTATLKSFSKALLVSMLGKGAGEYLFQAVRGKDPGIFREDPQSRSVSNEITFREDTNERDLVLRVLLELSHQVMFRLMAEQLKARTVYIKVRFEDFSTTTAQSTLEHYLSSGEELYEVALTLLDKRWNHSTPLRLIGVGASSIEEGDVPTQKELFENQYSRQRMVESAVFDLGKKLSDIPVMKASLLHKEKRREPPRENKKEAE